MSETAQAPKAEHSLSTAIARLAGVVGSPHYPAGDRAMLRRWAPGQAVPLSFYRLWLRHLGTDLPPENQTEAWMTVVWGLATMGSDAHDPKRPLGQALAESGYSEGRLERLLSAPEDVRIDLLMDVVRFLSSRHEHFNWSDAASFLLVNAGDKRESIHRRIAHAFYRHLPKDSDAKE